MTTSKQRLAQYRREADSPKWRRPLTWRDTKQHHPSPYGAPRPDNVRGPKGQIYSGSIDQYGTDVGDLNKLFPRLIDHSGWYADNFRASKVIGRVCRLRCPRGTLYIPTTLNTGCDGTVHYLADAELVPKGADTAAHDAACREAARSADRYAEQEAEAARDDEAKFLAEQDIEAAREAIHEGNAATLALLREIRQQPAGLPPTICAALRAQIKGMLADRAEQFRIIAARQADYWSAVERA